MSTQIEALPTKAPSVELIPIKKLIGWEKNVRQTKMDEGIASLAESIASVGLLNPLTVTKAARGRYAVVAGGRRLRALGLLVEDGRLAKDAGIACSFVEGNDAALTEISLTENVHREAMHPADEFEAFKILIDQGRSVVDVASRFGVTETVVNKRLKLARVSPWLLEQYRDGKMDLETLQAFTLTDDHEEQEQVWKSAPEYNRNARYIKQLLSKESVSAERDREVKFVGLDAYEAAGGEVRRSLFDDDVRVMDTSLLRKLATEKLEVLAGPIRNDGWKWVEIHPHPDHRLFYEFKQIHGTPVPLPKEIQEEDEQLRQELAELERGFYEFSGQDDDEDDPDDSDEETSVQDDLSAKGNYATRSNQIRERLIEIAGLQQYEFSEDEKLYSGVILSLDNWGNPDIRYGFVRNGDEPKYAKNANSGLHGSASQEASEPGGAYSAALLESLTQHKTTILAAELAASPKVALAATVHALLLSEMNMIRYDSRSSSCLQIHGTNPSVRETGEADAPKWLQRRLSDVAKQMPRTAAGIWAWCLQMPQAELLDLLALLAARTVDTVQKKFDQNKHRYVHADALGAALKTNPALWFKPTAENYFSRISKAQILSDLTEVGKAPPDPGKFKKLDLAKYAEDAMKTVEWVPGPVRIHATDAWMVKEGELVDAEFAEVKADDETGVLGDDERAELDDEPADDDDAYEIEEPDQNE